MKAYNRKLDNAEYVARELDQVLCRSGTGERGHSQPEQKPIRDFLARY